MKAKTLFLEDGMKETDRKHGGTLFVPHFIITKTVLPILQDHKIGKLPTPSTLLF